MYEPARRNAVYTLVMGLVLLLYGWTTGPLYDDTLGSFYNSTIDVFFATLRFGAVVFIVIAVLAFAGLRWALLLDSLASMICGLVMLLCGGYWIMETGFSLMPGLFVLFGVLFLKAAMSSFSLFKQGDSISPRAAALAPTESDAGNSHAAEPPHPASLHPDSLPGEDQPPPPEGYLAALSKEQSDPPDAAFK
jgi:hypothetical protein